MLEDQLLNMYGYECKREMNLGTCIDNKDVDAHRLCHVQ